MAEKINPTVLQELLERLAQDRNSESAWAELYKAVWPFVISTIFRVFGGASAGIEDVAQDVFLRLIRFCDFNAFPSSQAFLGYLHAVCQNAARDSIQRNAYVGSEVLEKMASPGANQRGIDSQMFLEKVFEGLKDDEKELAKYLLNGYTLKEIASFTNDSYGALAVRFHRLKSRLKAR